MGWLVNIKRWIKQSDMLYLCLDSVMDQTKMDISRASCYHQVRCGEVDELI